MQYFFLSCLELGRLHMCGWFFYKTQVNKMNLFKHRQGLVVVAVPDLSYSLLYMAGQLSGGVLA